MMHKTKVGMRKRNLDYELMDHTADLIIRSYGDTLEECFEIAGLALFDQIVDLSTVEPIRTCAFSVEGESMEDLLYSYLSELIFFFDAYGMVFCDIQVTLEKGRLNCKAQGEEIDPEKHHFKGAVKAVTYHMLEVDEEGPSVTVLFDV